MFTHGGAERQMYGAFHFGSAYAQLYAVNQYLVSCGMKAVCLVFRNYFDKSVPSHCVWLITGYAVISVNYRMGVGYGKQFRDCKECGYVFMFVVPMKELTCFMRRLITVHETKVGWGCRVSGCPGCCAVVSKATLRRRKATRNLWIILRFGQQS